MANAKTATLQRQTRLYVASFVALLAGLLYSSWPLESYLNPIISLHHGIASELGAFGQPYFWVFDLLDIASGLAVIIVAYVMWRMTKSRHGWLSLAIVCYATFGLLTIVDAVVPMRCLPSIQRCQSVWSDPQLLAHGFAGIASSIVLLFSAFAIWRMARLRSQEISLLMYIILLGWAMFGILSLIYFISSGPSYLTEHYFITLCSVWVASMPIVLSRLHLGKQV